MLWTAYVQLPEVYRGTDGVEMVLVRGGEFWMGSTPEQVGEACRTVNADPADCRRSLQHELPRHRILLGGYYIDRDEVTNAAFEGFLVATGLKAERSLSPTHPVVQVSWHDAEAYCAWAGKRLPTEAEWEKAARGTRGPIYPWGDSWDPARANGAISKSGPAPVGSYPGGASSYGTRDMAGNVWEWVADRYYPQYYSTSPRQNPTGPSAGPANAIVRGGSWIDHALALRSANRASRWRNGRDDTIGFRCVRDAR